MQSHDTFVRVRYAETDAMGFVYHTNYLVWFEVGRAEYMRAAGIPYSDLERQGIYLPVLECACRFVHPAHYDAALTVRTVVTELTRVKLTFRYEILEDGRLLATGHTTHVFTDREGKPTRIPAGSALWRQMQEAASR